MRPILPENVKFILNRLHEHGFEAFVAGGAVRDLLMNRTPHDYDISTNALPSEVKELFRKTIDTGLKHGTVTVIINKTGYEITTFRRDGQYTDGRHPESVKFVNSLREDCARRDFTVNAMCYNEEKGLIDFFCGKRDINQGIIRCVGNAEQRFKEDALRMLRAVRFAAVYGFKIEENTLKAIRKYAVLIKRVSSERIQSELNKLLLSDHPDYIRLLHETGILRYIIPPLERCFGEPQKNRFHIYDVGEHTMLAVKNTESDLILRWAALLHDIGKPCTSSTDSNGTIHFYGHHRESMRIADDILHRLRLDSSSIRDILVLIENHDVRIDPTPPAVKRMLAKTGPQLFEKLLKLQLADNSAKSPDCFESKKQRIDAVRNVYETVIASKEPYRISDLAINGRDLLKEGFRTGRILGDTLKALTEEVILNPSLNNRTYLLKRAAEIKKKNNRKSSGRPTV
ncbi:MAG: CCA tRNA nucleotidyltransferase [Clostridia bacterium]|nr:CCA tRNA nucleotidyltransferase [Clostridia bacterium]